MFALKTSEVVPFVGTEPSPLLTHLAGEFAPAIARLWPAPHAVFLTAPAARRQLACLALSIDGKRGRLELDQALCGLFRRAVKDLTPSVPGLVRALGRLGEQAWSAEDYGILLECLADAECGRFLHHSEVIEASTVRRLYSLPYDLFAAGAARLGLNEAEGRLISECYLALKRRDGDQAARIAAFRWAQAPNKFEAFRRADDDLLPEPAAPPFPGTSRLKVLATKVEVIDAGKRYSNCLRSRIVETAMGRSALYEWIGEPGAVVEICRDPIYGWRLEQAKRAENETVEPELREQIIAELRGMGVYVGYGSWNLTYPLAEIGDPDFSVTSISVAIANCF